MTYSKNRRGDAAASTTLTRRVVLKAGGAVVLGAVVPLSGCGGSSQGARPGDRGAAGDAVDPTPRARFLSDAERETLRALVDRMIPEDTDPGAVAGACHEAIDALLAAFLTDPPFIYAGGPFSDRGGEPDNDFLAFVELDEYEAFAWRLAIEGSQGIPEREFNGPVKGMQEIYREGLARLNERARQQGFDSFADTPAPSQDLIINDSNDATVQELVDIAFPDTLDAMYGPPEYGGNRDLVGWGFTDFMGDVQPRGWTDEQIINADDPGPFDFLLPSSYSEQSGNASQRSNGSVPSGQRPLLEGSRLPPLVFSSETMAHAMMAADGSLSKLRAQITPLTSGRISTVGGR